jgi:hypothetical protein
MTLVHCPWSPTESGTDTVVFLAVDYIHAPYPFFVFENGNPFFSFDNASISQMAFLLTHFSSLNGLIPSN